MGENERALVLTRRYLHGQPSTCVAYGRNIVYLSQGQQRRLNSEG